MRQQLVILQRKQVWYGLIMRWQSAEVQRTKVIGKRELNALGSYLQETQKEFCGINLDICDQIVTTEVVICCLCCSEGGVVVDTTRSKGASHWVWGESISLWRWAIPQRVAQEVVQCLSVRISGIWVEKSLNKPLCPCSWPCSDGIPAYCSDCESLMGAELAWLWEWEETKDRSFVTEQREGWKKPRFLFICRGREWWVNIKYQRCKIINIKRSGSKDLKLVINTWGVEMRNFLLWEVKLWEEAPKSSPRGGKCVTFGGEPVWESSYMPK